MLHAAHEWWIASLPDPTELRSLLRPCPLPLLLVLDDVVDVFNAFDERFSLMEAALQRTPMTRTLEEAESFFTVFAPTDEAFTAFIDASVDFASAEELLAYEGLGDVLLYHVVDGLVPAATVLTLTEATTKQGDAVTIDTSSGSVVLNGDVTVTQTDVLASNGLIHIIDGVLMPPAAPEPEPDGVGVTDPLRQ